jgi:hypothetical protein
MVLRLSGLCTTMIANFVTASGRNCIAEGAFSWRVRLRMGSLAPQGIFQSADGILHFAVNLIAFACELPVAGYLSNDFFGLLSTRIDLCPP